MSQEKVDRYKKEKANREKIMRRERWITRLEVTAFVVVLAALIGWFSMAVYQNSVAEKKANRTTETTTMNVTDIQNYLTNTNTSSDSDDEDTDAADDTSDSSSDSTADTASESNTDSTGESTAE
ncbi:hypothetical protein [Fusicatenibacter sp.]